MASPSPLREGSPLGGGSSSRSPSPLHGLTQAMSRLGSMAVETLSPGSSPGSRASAAAFLAAHDNFEEYDITEIWPKRVYAMAPPSVDSAAFLVDKFGAGNFLVWNLSDEPTHKLPKPLRVQVCDFHWSAPGKSQTPCLDALFKICFSIKAWLDLSGENAAFVFCSNGKTRTGIVLACLLRFCGRVDSSLEGFKDFCLKRCQMSLEEVLPKIPPTLVQFFRNFDDVLHHQHFPNRFPLVLDKVRITAVPVEDMPCIDIWDAAKEKVYSSASAPDGSKEWEDESGEYRDIGARLLGDFVLIVRFGGKYARDEADPSKILVRYVGNTAFLDEGPVPLSMKTLDVMKRYAAFFEEEAFELELCFVQDSAHFASASAAAAAAAPHRALPAKIYLGKEAVLEGLLEISRMHHLAPDVDRHRQLVVVQGFTCEAATLALQLGGNDPARAVALMGKLSPFMTTRDPAGPQLLSSTSEDGPDGQQRGSGGGGAGGWGTALGEGGRSGSPPLARAVRNPFGLTPVNSTRHQYIGTVRQVLRDLSPRIPSPTVPPAVVDRLSALLDAARMEAASAVEETKGEEQRPAPATPPAPSEPLLRCLVCFDDVPVTAGIVCKAAAEKDHHFICLPCLEGTMRYELGERGSQSVRSHCFIRCPSWTDGCAAEAWGPVDLAQKLSADAKSFYLERVHEVYLHLERREQARREEEARQADERRRDEVGFHHNRIAELLVLKCPHCGRGFTDVDGCNAVSCEGTAADGSQYGCGTVFCFVCFEEGNSRQVHDHMTRVGHWFKGEELETFRRVRRIEAVSEYLRRLAEPLCRRVIEASTRTLGDVGIGAEDLVL